MDYQRVWAEINLDAIANNTKNLVKHKKENCSLMAIVKADGYGHGAVEVSKVALYNGAEELGVAIYDEGVLLRENNIHVPILILGYTPIPKLYEVVNYNLTQTIFHTEMAKALSESAVKLKKTATIHIKIDTGMGRLGFMPSKETVKEIIAIAKLPNIIIEGIYTHFAVSDYKDDNFTNIQFDKFVQLIKMLELEKLYIPIKHVSNSGAIINFPDYNLNMVRSGILLYGLAPYFKIGIDHLDLKPAMALKTHTSYIKELDKGVSVGYSRNFYTQKKSIIATVPVGYADGYFRSFGNKGRVLVNGEYAPIVGNICMDQFMIDVTHIQSLKDTNDVVLLGDQGNGKITADELAKIENTINYEIVCNVGKRVPRVYIKDNEILKTC